MICAETGSNFLDHGRISCKYKIIIEFLFWQIQDIRKAESVHQLPKLHSDDDVQSLVHLKIVNGKMVMDLLMVKCLECSMWAFQFKPIGYNLAWRCFTFAVVYKSIAEMSLFFPPIYLFCTNVLDVFLSDITSALENCLQTLVCLYLTF